MTGPVTVYLGNLPRDVRKREVEDIFRKYTPDDIAVKRGYAFLTYEDERDAEDAINTYDGERFCGRKIIVERQRGSGPHGRDRIIAMGYNMRDVRDRSRSKRRSRSRSRSRSRRRSYSRSRSRGRGGRRRSRSGMRYLPKGRYRIIIEDVPRETSWQDLKDFAKEWDCPRPITAVVRRLSRKGYPVGIMEFDTARDVDEAIDRLDGRKIQPGRGAPHSYSPTRVRVYEDKPGDSRSRSRSGSYSRSRSRSRSRSKSRDEDKKEMVPGGLDPSQPAPLLGNPVAAAPANGIAVPQVLAGDASEEKLGGMVLDAPPGQC